jgi:hypothetical protein
MNIYRFVNKLGLLKLQIKYELLYSYLNGKKWIIWIHNLLLDLNFYIPISTSILYKILFIT